jgi:hypothetical protein
MTRRSRVSAETVRALALGLPQVVESSHFAQPDFRVRNRIFATLPKADDVVCLKTLPANLDALVTADAETFRTEWRGRWLRVRLDRVTAPMLEDLLFEAWKLVAPKSLVVAFVASLPEVGASRRTGSRRNHDRAR